MMAWNRTALLAATEHSRRSCGNRILFFFIGSLRRHRRRRQYDEKCLFWKGKLAFGRISSKLRDKRFSWETVRLKVLSKIQTTINCEAAQRKPIYRVFW